LGRPEVAREREFQMIAVTNGNKPQNIAFAEYSSSYLHTLNREYEQAAATAARAIELAEKHQIVYFAILSRSILGDALAQLGRVHEGKAQLRSGIRGQIEAGARLGVGTQITTWLAVAEACDGAVNDALRTIEQALLGNSAELIYRPETLRIRGELRLKNGEPALAETDFHESINLAQSMGAKSWELRSTISFARLLDATSRRAEAYTMLSEVYGWFTEGFDTRDLKDAKFLMEELRGQTATN
jgi:hypothetical protein